VCAVASVTARLAAVDALRHHEEAAAVAADMGLVVSIEGLQAGLVTTFARIEKLASTFDVLAITATLDFVRHWYGVPEVDLAVH